MAEIKLLVMSRQRFKQIVELAKKLGDKEFDFKDIMDAIDVSKWTAYNIIDDMIANDIVEERQERYGRRVITRYKFKKWFLEAIRDKV